MISSSVGKIRKGYITGAIILIFSCAAISQVPRPLTLADAVDLALKQASGFRGAQIGERIAAEDVTQAKSAFLPKVEAKPNYIFTSPSLGPVRPRLPSYLGANAINEIQALVVASGELDTSGKLKATLIRNQALLESARAGTEVARRDLIQGVAESYYGLAVTAAKRAGAEKNLASAEEFETNTKLQLDAGEVAPVDLVRARLQTGARRDELEQAKTDESVNSNGLRLLIGYAFTDPVLVNDILTETPADNEIERFAEAAISTRPEFAQFEADKKAAESEIKVARAERHPQFTYSVSSGFITDSFAATHIKDSAGVQVNVGVTIPIFDWGAARSHEIQAKLRLQQVENSRAIAERQLAQAFFTARTQAISARTRIRQIGAAITDAEANVAASTARYHSGEATIMEVIDAQNTLVTQKTALYQALFDYQTARARLMRATGQ
ncbi:MAG: TolC family protein [Acidobacteriota bacterium]